ncbi:hypothetical protein EV363DRAFT_1250373 [Boletus edulis]|uniref:MYND-type domain-containing protein n=1 Tax=Boletus edulis BED1 TaxID=1328754 RepID=A0AAD4GIQ2_BOLED|nr:hypothetical protein EV363DRAFT_1250373 [Boletus edulis]KAF8446127.1 hypothetical protein L210DRAFT_3443021 [Boletus edulis BED1]
MQSLNIPMPTAADLNRITYLGAAKFKEAMSRPDGHPEKLDFSIMASCFNCDGPRQKPLVCSACRSAVYCSKKCQIANWKTGRFGTEGHKSFCERNKVRKYEIG